MAQKKTSKSSATKKSNTSKRTASSKSNSRSRAPEKKSGMNPQTKAILLCAASVIFFALVFIKGGALWYQVRSFIFGLFGMCSILIPVLFLYLGIMTAKEKEMAHKGTKIALSVLIVLDACALFYLFGGTDYNSGNTYGQALAAAYQGSFEYTSLCGLFGALLGYPMREWLTNAPSVIICIVALIVALMILFSVSLLDIANVAKKGYQKHIEHRESVRERNEERRISRAENNGESVYDDSYSDNARSRRRSSDRIDIPIDGEKRVKKPKDPERIAEEQQDDEILNIIRNAAAGTAPDTDPGIFAAAEHIAPAEPPKPADTKPQPVDLSEETRSIDESVHKQQEHKNKQKYIYPPTKLLNPRDDTEGLSAYNEMQNNATKLIETLRSFGVDASIINISRGPSVTRYELQPGAGVKISKITALSDDIALSLAADGIRIEAPIPGKSAVGIEVPNKVISRVTIRELLESDEFRSSKSKLYCVLGRNISGEIICTELSAMPHLLVAGTTGSGKSVCVNSLLLSILFRATPDEVKLLLIDPKMVEFNKYKGIPHLLVPVVSDAKKAAGALNWAVSEMLSRYRIFSEFDCKGIESFNELVDKNLAYIEEQKSLPDYDPEAEEQPCMEIDGLKVPTERMCRIVIAIDELADLMMAAPNEVEESICRLAQMARAAGMHLIIATQRPSVNVITGVIKANIPSRIALQVSSQVDSRTILDSVGAEKLIGKGDMLYSPVGLSKPLRVQGCFATDDEIERVTDFIKKSHTAEYNREIEDKIRQNAAEVQAGKPSKGAKAAADVGSTEVDSLMEEAIKVVIDAGQASSSLLQRRLKVGYSRAGRMVDEMEQMGIVGPHQGSKPREVLMTYNDWLERRNNMSAPASDPAPTDESDPW